MSSRPDQAAPVVVTLPAETGLYNRAQACDQLHAACAAGAAVVIAGFAGTRSGDAGAMGRLLDV
jgi:hypothetical protein